MFNLRRITLFCFDKRLSKHKMTILSKNFGGHGPFGPPWLRLCFAPARKFSAYATDPSPILYDAVPHILCTDQLLSHCIWSNVHWQLVYLLCNSSLYCFPLLAKSWNNEPMEQFTHSCWNISLHVEIGVGLQHIYTQTYLSANQNCKVWSCALKHGS